jgi:Ku70/Ku80 N-terminal alpha/beta domain
MADPSVPNFFDNDSDGEDDDFEFANTGRNGLIFMVDCSASMFEDQDGADPPASNFSTILECVEQTMKNLIITSATTLMGIVFYNVRNSPEPKMEVEMLKNGTFVVPEKTAIFIPMTVLSADVIKYVRHCKESADFFDFENRYGHTDGKNGLIGWNSTVICL